MPGIGILPKPERFQMPRTDTAAHSIPNLNSTHACCTGDESQESIACRRQNSQARDPPWLWNSRHHQKSRTWVLVALQKGLMYSIFILCVFKACWPETLWNVWEQIIKHKQTQISKWTKIIQIHSLPTTFMYNVHGNLQFVRKFMSPPLN